MQRKAAAGASRRRRVGHPDRISGPGGPSGARRRLEEELEQSVMEGGQDPRTVNDEAIARQQQMEADEAAARELEEMDEEAFAAAEEFPSDDDLWNRNPFWDGEGPRVEDLKDPADELINYGHRAWPILNPETFIRDMMAFCWPGAKATLTYQKDKFQFQRTKKLVEEFNKFGLPQTMHADHRHEQTPGASGASGQTRRPLEPSWRCWCWRDRLGQNYFNDTDATIIRRLGPLWMNDSQLLLHILKRVLPLTSSELAKCYRTFTLNHQPSFTCSSAYMHVSNYRIRFVTIMKIN
ncbi:hypothetical protein Mapa_000073 [Marchantia paleacea]|nr:hypothetical protein Mapa_000073 [Marchantia paleacea]